MIDDYEETKIEELSQLKESLQGKVHKEAEKQLGNSKINKIKKDIKMENDIKFRQNKRELQSEMGDEVRQWRKGELRLNLSA